MTFFIMATFFTQITMLNMLIAIMGDSFSFVTENRERFATEIKLEILISQSSAMAQRERQDATNVYLILVRPLEDEEDTEEWQGSINKVASLTTKAITSMR